MQGQFIKKFLILGMLLFVSACAASASQGRQDRFPVVKPGHSLLIVSVDPDQLNPLTILIDDRVVATINRKQALFVHILPGDHRVRSSSANSFPLDLYSRVGETVHIRAVYTEKGTHFTRADGWNERTFEPDTNVIEFNF